MPWLFLRLSASRGSWRRAARGWTSGWIGYIFVGLVCVRQAYQGQGYMRKVMKMAFAEGNRLGIPVILETDARSKCDKYLHLGMKLAGTRRFGTHGLLYDLIRYPETK